MEPINTPQETPQESNEAPQGDSPQLSEREIIEQEAIDRYKESQQTSEERADGVPEGFNEDGTPQEELIDGKFKSQEDLLTAYHELQKKLGQGDQNDTAEGEATESGDAPSEAPSGLDTSKFETEYAENGNLSEESYAELAKQGFDKAAVDQYIQGQTYYAQSVQNDIYSTVGGQEQYTEVIQWASENMDPAAIKDYNEAVDKMDVAKVKRDLEYMKLKKDGVQQQSQDPRRLEGTAPAGGMQPFKDKGEWQRAQVNRLYGKDAKYTNMVDNRYLASRRKGFI